MARESIIGHFGAHVLLSELRKRDVCFGEDMIDFFAKGGEGGDACGEGTLAKLFMSLLCSLNGIVCFRRLRGALVKVRVAITISTKPFERIVCVLRGLFLSFELSLELGVFILKTLYIF